jgi:hypothetical protein
MMIATLWFITLAYIVSSAQAYCDDGMYVSSYSSYSQSCRYNRIILCELLNFKVRKCSQVLLKQAFQLTLRRTII